jgi:glycosyltransferase involved in cell wall biosynthesis
MSMRIAIDARLNAYRQGGISQYTRQLLTALADAAPDDQFVSLQHRDQLRPLAIAPNVLRRATLTPPHHRLEQWTWPLEVLLARPSVLHSPDFIAPLRRPCPAVVTIHDLAFMHYPEILDEAAGAYYGQVRANTPRADGIIAVSEATRQDIAQFLDIPIEQIDVIYEAAAPLYQRIDLREGEARVLNSTPVEAGTFMLFVSTLEPRKNLPTLLQALRICLDRRPDAGYRLVIVGRRGWRDEAIFTAVRDLRLGEHVFFAGGVGQYDLRWLYNACRLYINPSLYEGFGLPLLEAMACGAACLAAATSSLPEIGGNAALYVPPLDADVWADEIAALWGDDDRRAELSRLGLARARQFSWARAARETLKVYRRAAERIVPQSSMAQAPLQAGMVNDSPATPTPERAVASPAGPRACLRCGAGLVPGRLQQQLALRTADAAADTPALAPRLWACARCGHTELVVDWAAALAPAVDLTAAPAGEAAPPYAIPEAPVAEAAPALADVAVIEAVDTADPISALVDEQAAAPVDAAPSPADHAEVEVGAPPAVVSNGSHPEPPGNGQLPKDAARATRPAATPDAAPPAKRRQSRSKRKGS